MQVKSATELNIPTTIEVEEIGPLSQLREECVLSESLYGGLSG